MLARFGLELALVLAAAPVAVKAVSISAIQGTAWLSPYAGQTVHNVTGTVTAKVRHECFYRLVNAEVSVVQGPSGIWIQGEASNDTRSSSGLYIYGSSVINKTAVCAQLLVDEPLFTRRTDW
jgi:predicted extracellular nuclease